MRLFVGTLLAAAITIPSQMTFKADGTGSISRKISSKLGDVVSVRDFGCTGDGVVNDSTCVANALTASGSNQYIDFSCPGTYKTTAYGTLACGDYYPPIAGATGSTPRSMPSKILDIVDVKDFGATGDGATDDTTAINNAVTYASSVQGEVYFPHGTYRITSAIHSKQNIRLIGSGPKFGSVILPDGTAAFKILGADQVGGIAFRFFMENLLIQPVNTPASTKMIEIVTAYSIHLRDVFIYNITDNSTTGIDITDAAEVLLEGLVIYGAGNTTTKGVVTNTSAGTTSVKVMRADFELLNHALENNGSGVVDVYSPYMERNIIGIDNNAGASGRVTVSGGEIYGTNNSTQCIRTLGTNTFIFGTLLDPGTGTHRLVTALNAKVYYHDTSTNTVFLGPSTAAGADLSPATTLQVAGTITTKALVVGAVTPTYGVAVTIDASLGNEFIINATNGTAFTISDPTNTQGVGQRILIRVSNGSGGALGAVTWGAGAYKLAAWANPANGNNRAIEFIWESGSPGHWFEVSRTMADVAN